MKKRLTIFMAAALVLMLVVPAFAANPTSGSGEDVEGFTTITHTVNTTYAIIIPESISVAADANNKLSGSGTFSLTAGGFIPANQYITFAITAATNYDNTTNTFRLINGDNANVYIPYTISMPNDTDLLLDEEFIYLAPDEAHEDGASVVLTVTTDEAYKSAGTYSDKLTITVALVDTAPTP